MAYIGLGGAVRAAAFALVFVTTVAQAQDGSAAAVWQLRSGLNVAALGCRGGDEAAIVAGYNRLLADHRAELAAAYRTVARDYGSPAAFDAAMTRTYNLFAQPAAQATLCANALAVLDAVAADPGRPLDGVADAALARLQRTGQATNQVAMASIPQILDTRTVEVEDGIPDGE